MPKKVKKAIKRAKRTVKLINKQKSGAGLNVAEGRMLASGILESDARVKANKARRKKKK